MIGGGARPIGRRSDFMKTSENPRTKKPTPFRGGSVTKRKIVALRRIDSVEELVAVSGKRIPKGTRLHVIAEGPVHPLQRYRCLLIRVDNGTGHLDLMPEDGIRELENGKLETPADVKRRRERL